MRRNRSPTSPSPYRALAHGAGAAGPGGLPDSLSLLRSFNSDSNPTRPMRPSPLTASTIRDMPLDLVDRIRSFPLFVSAPEEFLAAIGNHMRPQVHAAQDHILTEGDDARAMYWLVRGVVAVTSRDGEAIYAELKPGAFFGEIGVLMNIPRTATIIARTKCLLVVLKKEDLQAELPKFPDMEKAIRQEAQERLNILKKKRQEGGQPLKSPSSHINGLREPAPGEVSTGEVGTIKEGTVVNSKKRKSPSPGAIEDPAAGSALGSGFVNVRKTLKELPLFSTLPPDILHFLGLSAQPKTYAPFTDIIQQGSAGNEIFFIVRGEAEVIHEAPSPHEPFKKLTRASYIRPRLKAGQYFGEVASLGLSEGRTATVRAITTVECLMIPGDALDKLWSRCPPDIKSQVEETARKRYKKSDDDVEMADADPRERTSKSDPPTPTTPKALPHIAFTTPSKPASPTKDDDTMEPKDPDPFLSVDMENMRNRRRNSLAPPTPQSDTSSPTGVNGFRVHQLDSTPLRFSVPQSPPDSEVQVPVKRARTLPRRPHPAQTPALPDDMLVAVFRFLDIAELMRARLISSHWRKLLTTHPEVCLDLDLSEHNRRVTDLAIKTWIGPFVGTRPETIDISNCFHITDDGFRCLWESCGRNVKRWRMRSVWDVSANQILDMAENAKDLEEVDWSNCRKVGDNLLARVVGWVVPEPPPPPPASKQVVISSSNAKAKPPKAVVAQQVPRPANIPKPGTIIGCPKLKHLNLSYCKHITDRSMAHMAAHASNRIESLSLTRCTSITDAGFQSWAPFRFLNLSHLCLADCTYLSDNAIVALVGAAKNLTHLDLSFCCALSDTATEVVALGLPNLRELRLAFCGSAVSDASLQSVALHLNELEGISVRGCVRVTGAGVENLLEGCSRIQWVDVSQCRNLEHWIRSGGVMRWGFDERGGNGLSPGQVPLPLPSPKPTTNHVGLGGRPHALSIRRRARKPVRFIVEKGVFGLR